jgi:hypothetical protein
VKLIHEPTGWPQRATELVLLPARLLRATSPEALSAWKGYGIVNY